MDSTWGLNVIAARVLSTCSILKASELLAGSGFPEELHCNYSIIICGSMIRKGRVDMDI